MYLVMGLGKSGKSVMNYLSNKNIPFVLYDENKELLFSYKEMGLNVLSDYDIKDISFCIKSPGIPPHNDIVVKCLENNIPILSDVGFFFQEYAPNELIAITGTNGKTTVTRMIAMLLREKDPIVGGNVGTPIFDFPFTNKPYVLELSSFQLEDAKNIKPSRALLLNVKDDHLDWHGNFNNYKNAKFNIFKNMDKTGYLIIDNDDENLRDIKANTNILRFSLLNNGDDINAYLKDDCVLFKFKDRRLEIKLSEFYYKEKHNIRNYMASILLALSLSLTDDEIYYMIKNFRLDHHRMEFIGVRNGSRVIDDSKATNPAATISALNSIDDEVILLLGGFDKGMDLKELLEFSSKRAKHLIFFGDMKDRLSEIANSLDIDYYIEDSLKEACDKAIAIAKGETILLSPSTSSFDEFKGYDERGNKFREYMGV